MVAVWRAGVNQVVSRIVKCETVGAGLAPRIGAAGWAGRGPRAFGRGRAKSPKEELK